MIGRELTVKPDASTVRRGEGILARRHAHDLQERDEKTIVGHIAHHDAKIHLQLRPSYLPAFFSRMAL